MEVEFPVSGLDSVAGDGEGCAEMSASSGYLSAVLSELMRRGNDKPTKTRVLFPDKNELLFQKRRRDSANSQGEASGGLITRRCRHVQRLRPDDLTTTTPTQP